MMPNPHASPSQFLRGLFTAAIDSARPDKILAPYVPSASSGRIVIIGAGKASAAMAQVIEQEISAEISGTVVTRYGYAVPCEHIQILEAAHPVPDEAGLRASQKILQDVSALTKDDVVLCLISGGGSALLPYPSDGLSLAQKQAINQALLQSGATISEMNVVRRHLSNIKGGRLAAAAYPAQVINLIISDVPGDNPQDIASGPTVADPSTCDQALDILQRYQIAVPDNIRKALESKALESIKPNDDRLSRVTTHIVASSQLALSAAADIARQAGITPMILGDSIEGESRDVATVLAGIARQVRHYGQPLTAPCVLLSGGETTVTVKGSGKGGRNVEFLLALANALQGCHNVYAVAGDTDGVDGQEEVAGAFITPETLDKARTLGLKPLAYLDNNDGHSFFQALDQQIITGPTLTNVNDFRAILIL